MHAVWLSASASPSRRGGRDGRWGERPAHGLPLPAGLGQGEGQLLDGLEAGVRHVSLYSTGLQAQLRQFGQSTKIITSHGVMEVRTRSAQAAVPSGAEPLNAVGKASEGVVGGAAQRESETGTGTAPCAAEGNLEP